MHWPDDPEWLEQLTPNDVELQRTGLSFNEACTASAMCSPSRASFLTGTYPSRHGVNLTLSNGDYEWNMKNGPATLREALRLALRGDVPRKRLVRTFLRGMFRLPPHSGNEPELPAGVPTLGTRLRDVGYTVIYKGKWHLTSPLAGGFDWSKDDVERIDRDFGFGEWEPPDAGENARAEHFGGGNAGKSGQGWDEDYIRQVEAFLARDDLPEPFCLVVSLVNPHDVLGYPDSFEEGGYSREDFADLDVPLPRTLNESLGDKPAVHAIMKMGQITYIGPLDSDQKQRDYVNFYAHLQRVVDEKIGRMLTALGDADDPKSLRSRTVITRISDHGEMGLSHGGLRQKMFNAYDETIRVPLVFSNPLLFPGGAETNTPASLIDLVPTLLGLAGAPVEGILDGVNLTGVLAQHATPDKAAVSAADVDLSGVTAIAPVESVRDHIFFTTDDHSASTNQLEAPGKPNRVRCVRERRWKYAVYVDPDGRAASEYELYDLQADPDEAKNLVGVRTGKGITPDAERERIRLAEVLANDCRATFTRI